MTIRSSRPGTGSTGAGNQPRAAAPPTRKWAPIAVAVVCVAMAAGFLALRKRRMAAPPPVRPEAAVITQSEISLSGTIRPQHVVSVGAQVSGNIEAFLVNVGDDVFEGQALARVGTAGLESDREAAAQAVANAEQQISTAESAVNAARMETSRAEADAQRARMALDRVEKVYNRQKTLHAAGATPPIVFQKAEQDYELALQDFDTLDKAARGAADNLKILGEKVAVAKKALAERTQQLEDAQQAYEAAEVRSPVDGLVVGRGGEQGKPVQEAGDQLFSIATDIYALEVALEPSAEVMKRLHPGQPALVAVLDLQAGGIPGVVKEIKGTQVIVEFNSTMPAIRPGMRADVRLKLE